jgi:hypothetical protein
MNSAANLTKSMSTSTIARAVCNIRASCQIQPTCAGAQPRNVGDINIYGGQSSTSGMARTCNPATGDLTNAYCPSWNGSPARWRFRKLQRQVDRTRHRQGTTIISRSPVVRSRRRRGHLHHPLTQ